MPLVAPIDSAQELRAEIARQMMPIYWLAPKVGLHPAHLGQALRGRRPLTPEMASRIRAALAEIAPDEPTPHVVA
jgi:DNA-binding transcriptional regulator YdaS (Cro superfamily)